MTRNNLIIKRWKLDFCFACGYLRSQMYEIVSLYEVLPLFQVFANLKATLTQIPKDV